jgi:hypothetical protein
MLDTLRVPSRLTKIFVKCLFKSLSAHKLKISPITNTQFSTVPISVRDSAGHRCVQTN